MASSDAGPGVPHLVAARVHTLAVAVRQPGGAGTSTVRTLQVAGARCTTRAAVTLPRNTTNRVALVH